MEQNKEIVDPQVALAKVVKILATIGVEARLDSDKTPTELNGGLFISTRLQAKLDNKWVDLKVWTTPIDPKQHIEQVDKIVAELEQQKVNQAAELAKTDEVLTKVKADAETLKTNLQSYIEPKEEQEVAKK